MESSRPGFDILINQLPFFTDHFINVSKLRESEGKNKSRKIKKIFDKKSFFIFIFFFWFGLDEKEERGECKK